MNIFSMNTLEPEQMEDKDFLKDLPDSLNGAYWLEFFGSEEIVIWLDRHGNPLHILQRNNHYNRDIAGELMKNPIHRYFNLPPGCDLNELVEPGTKPALFVSKNVAEALVLFPFWVLDFPLTTLRIFRLKEDRYLGVVHFMKISHELTGMENKLVLLSDDHDLIIGYNSVLIERLGIDADRSLLGRPLSALLTFNRDPFYPDRSLKPSFEPLKQWQAGKGAFPFEPAKNSPGTITESEYGLLWENDSPDTNSSLILDDDFRIDRQSFKLEIGFRSLYGTLPNLIFRGRRNKDDTVSDAAGYMLTSLGPNDPLSFRYVLKQAGLKVRNYPLTLPEKTAPSVLAVCKTGDHFEFFLNDKPIGRWLMGAPLAGNPGNILSLFLRPGTKLLLNRITLSSGGYSAEETNREPLTARAGETRKRDYQVSIRQGTLTGRNYCLFQLEDVTYYRSSIETLSREKERLETFLNPQIPFIGISPSILAIKENLPVVARSDLSVLIEGDTGTGKEVLAHALHAASERRSKPFVKVDCSTIPQGLMESELFGHEKGSFTGAEGSHAGRFEQAEGGTIFFDEISNLTMSTQATLLSVLQDFQIHRVGGVKAKKVDVRVIVASNLPLISLVKEGRFRQDLYYRINQFRFELPPLNARKEDLPLLINHFIDEANRHYGKKIEGLHPQALKAVYDAVWPGNIRELRNVMLRAALFCKGSLIEKKEIALEQTQPHAEQAGTHAPKAAVPPPSWGGRRKKTTLESDQFRKVLSQVRGNVNKAVKKLGISRGMAYKMIAAWKIDVNSFRD